MLGWSQGDLAEAAAVSRTTIVDFERSIRIPHRNNLVD
ncbi:XRE family transcriptional regulator (plasmid) [Mesorhizobium loti]|uniref:XRE family transcriptional regulator n=2 Tax=Mesorhizobium jarvisii TaxID=1777867 RepID=A0A6M7TWL1_9HYPH|nr:MULTISPECIES: helix-turn-helix transcriptional regulator [Mesorhizobium]QKC67517.1 XRE family transcriptional regulator [Mesorhizobium jarvisii]QKD13431.1 XRE family transcriptional regulator [Mesorhizobium loti]RJT29608.1 XRE family transcriptional regulator [Mesorhizobium jarvisii]